MFIPNVMPSRKRYMGSGTAYRKTSTLTGPHYIIQVEYVPVQVHTNSYVLYILYYY